VATTLSKETGPDIVVAMQEREAQVANEVTDMIQTTKTSFYQQVIEENTRNPWQL